jgi:hypothetical protein
MTTVTVRVFYRQAAYGGWKPGSLHPSPGRLCALTTGVTALTGRHGLINCYDAFIHLSVQLDFIDLGGRRLDGGHDHFERFLRSVSRCYIPSRNHPQRRLVGHVGRRQVGPDDYELDDQGRTAQVWTRKTIRSPRPFSTRLVALEV